MKSLINRILINLPVTRTLFREEVKYSDGSVLENRLGYQIFRMLTGRLIITLRRMKQRETGDKDFECYLNEIRKNGIVVIPDFLPSHTFLDIKKEVKHLEEHMEFRPHRQHKSRKPVKLLEGAIDLKPDGERCQNIYSFLTKNPLITRIAEAVTGVSIRGLPDVTLWEHKIRSDGEYIDNDLENILHSDLHLATVKAYYLINETTRENGAFVYAKGSQEMTFTRLKHEYTHSVYNAALKRGKNIPVFMLGRRGDQTRIIIPESDLTAMGVQECFIEGGPNTLIIANTFGFHRRGEFELGSIRKEVLLNFRKFNRGWS